LILAQAKTEALTETNWNRYCYEISHKEHQFQAASGANLTAQANLKAQAKSKQH
jgi:hypothetical protein